VLAFRSTGTGPEWSCAAASYFDLLERREEKSMQESARPDGKFYAFRALLKKTWSVTAAQDWIWARSVANMGGWTFMEPRLRALGYQFEYVGATASSSPATGSLRVHRRDSKSSSMRLEDAALIWCVRRGTQRSARAGAARRLSRYIRA